MKPCKQCGETKSFDQFFKHRETKDGLRSKCKACFTAQTTAWRRANPEKSSAYSTAYQKRNPENKRKHSAATYMRHREKRLAYCKEWREKNRERMREYDAARRAEHPEREQARSAVRWAVERGAIVKPCACERCGAASPLDGHHWSYEREHWLDVEWICRSCHLNEHRAEARLYREVELSELA